MPFEFVRNLKLGVWTNIERSWLQKLQKHLSQAENTLIKHVRFIRKIKTDNRMKESGEYEDDHEKYIFKIFTPKGDTYFVKIQGMSHGSMEKLNACAILLRTEIFHFLGGPRRKNPQIALKHHLFHHAHVLVIV